MTTMGTKHTPGPWEASCREHLIGNPYHGLFSTRVNGAHKGAVANAIGPCESECDSNARLIAAAPELLEVLKRIRDGYDANNNEDIGFAMYAARATIAKAEGGEA